jgi:putative ABC transport system permease protein
MMWQATLRDLQWRRRRFMIAITGTALVFAMTLLLSGLSASFTLETDRTLKAIGGDVWVVKEGASGPFTAFSPVPETDAARVAAVDGVTEAQPIIYLHQTVGDEPKDINLFGVVPGALGEPAVSKGRGLQGPGEALADSTLGADVGETVQMAGRDYEVVGVTKHTTLNGGIATMFITLDDAQTLLGGNPIASAIVATGVPTAPIDGLRVMTLDEARTDLLRPLKNASQSIDFVKILLWIVAACIIGSIVYLSAMERTRDFAVFKATGTSNGALGAGLALQAVILAIAAAVLASVIAILLAPVFPLPVEIPTSAFVILFGIAIVVGLLASLAGLRRAVKVEPALAFGGP